MLHNCSLCINRACSVQHANLLSVCRLVTLGHLSFWSLSKCLLLRNSWAFFLCPKPTAHYTSLALVQCLPHTICTAMVKSPELFLWIALNWRNVTVKLFSFYWLLSSSSCFEGLKPHGLFWSPYYNPKVLWMGLLGSLFLLVDVHKSLCDSGSVHSMNML